MFNDGKCFLVKLSEKEARCITCDSIVSINPLKIFSPVSKVDCSNPKPQEEVKELLTSNLLTLPDKINKYAHHVLDTLTNNKTKAPQHIIDERHNICVSLTGVCYTGIRCKICKCPVNKQNPWFSRNKAGWLEEECPNKLWGEQDGSD